MATLKRLSIALILVSSGCFFSLSVYAECGGSQQCIAVSIDAGVPPAHGTPLTSAPLAFGSQDVATMSANKTIFVGAVTGAGSATLDAITLGGANASEYSITGGTCTTGSANLPHGGAPCTITVAFNPASAGAKSATVQVVTSAITRTTPLTGTGNLPAPMITSGLAVSGTAGVVFSTYQITATNNPTSFTASPLPPGLSVNASGTISGTPTADGAFNTIITATNATGTDTETLVITISLTAPVITSGTAVSGATGVVFSGYQITATNNPTSFNATGLPAGLGVNTITGLISGTPTAGGIFIVAVSATNSAATASQQVTFTIASEIPIVRDASITVPVNTSETLDLAPFITGAAISGIRITVAPAHGGVAISNTAVTYTPVNNYFGPDVFSYVGFNNDGESAPAVVTVTVVGRPDPARDPIVRSLVRSHMETAKRFSRSQISNFQQRMESLHSVSGTDVDPAPVASINSVGIPGHLANSVSGDPHISGDMQFGNNPSVHLAGAPGTFHRLDSADATPAPLPSSFITTLLTAATTGTVNLSSSSAGSNKPAWLPDGIGIWIGGNFIFGTRDQTGDSSGLRFSTDGISVGMDRWFSDKLALGLGLGYARGHTAIGSDGSKDRSKSISISAYGSYQPTTNIFIDGHIGYGDLRYDTDRYVEAVDDFSRSHREGDQLFGSVAVGYEYRKDGLLISPYGRMDFTFDDLDQTTETGTGVNALTYFDQSLETGQLSLGLRTELLYEASFGWVLPRLRLEYKHEFEGDRLTTIAYADQLAGPRFSLSPAGTTRNSVLISTGSNFDFKNGFKIGVEYQGLYSSGPDQSQSIRFWLRKELDGSPMLLGQPFSKLFKNPIRIEAGYSWEDNLNRARESANKLLDQSYTINIRKGIIFSTGSHTRMLVNGYFNGQKFRKHDGLDRISASLHSEFQYRTSAKFDALTFGLFGRVSVDEYDSELRAGYRYSFGVNARRSLTDRIDIFGAFTRNVRNADSDVFDTKDYSARLNVDYSLRRNGVLYIGGEYRRGDTASSAPNSDFYLDIADASELDDAYYNRRFNAFRYEAETLIWTFGYNWFLGQRDSIDFSFRHVDSSPTDIPADGNYGGSGSTSYTSNQFSIVYLMRF
jgi:uncharacterized protein YhjY with autotransporter beta-barrel domain